MAGMAPLPENGQAMLLGLAKLDASNQNAVIGVARQAVLNKTVTLEDGSKHVDFQPATGSIGSKNYLIIVTGGLAPAVNISSLGVLRKGRIGDKIALAGQSDGELAVALHSEVSRSPYQAPAIVIGKMAGPVDETNGTVPIFIDID